MGGSLFNHEARPTDLRSCPRRIAAYTINSDGISLPRFAERASICSGGFAARAARTTPSVLKNSTRICIMTWQEWTIVALLAGITSVAGGEVIVSHLTKPHRSQVAKSTPARAAGAIAQDGRAICRSDGGGANPQNLSARSSLCALAPR